MLANASGATGLELLQALLLDGALARGVDLRRLAQVLAYNPARLFSLQGQKGALEVGCDADLVVLRHAPYTYFAKDSGHNFTDWSPYDGRTVNHRVARTMLPGSGSLPTAKCSPRRGRGSSSARRSCAVAVNGARLWQNLLALSAITEPDKPYTRRSFSPRFLEGRQWLTAQMQAAGLATRIDSAGNLIGRLPGNGTKTGVIAIGSHSDSVPSGGRFDGIAGVLTALECAQSWREQGITLNHDVEIIDYLAEEPSEWGISCIGSRGISGFLDAALLATPHPQTGETLAAAIARMGGRPDALQTRDDIAAAFELHIEQGQVLEAGGIAVGIVSGIVGIIRLEVVLHGQANHAGTTPMPLRHDALCAAAEIVLVAETLAQELAESGEGYVVATCGQIVAEPNASNVIAGETRLVFDIRSDQRALMLHYLEQLQARAEGITARRGIAIARWARLTDTAPVLADAALMAHLQAAAEAVGASQITLPSGAGHDSAFLAQIAPMVMLFVPSKDGKSHCPEEWTDAAALATGAAVLQAGIERFDGE